MRANSNQKRIKYPIFSSDFPKNYKSLSMSKINKNIAIPPKSYIITEITQYKSKSSTKIKCEDWGKRGISKWNPEKRKGNQNWGRRGRSMPDQTEAKESFRERQLMMKANSPCRCVMDQMWISEFRWNERRRRPLSSARKNIHRNEK